MTAIETFIKKTETATKARSKEMRLTVQEAQLLVMEFSGLLAKENVLLDRIDKMRDTIQVAPVTPLLSGDVVMDGGGFK